MTITSNIQHGKAKPIRKLRQDNACNYLGVSEGDGIHDDEKMKNHIRKEYY